MKVFSLITLLHYRLNKQSPESFEEIRIASKIIMDGYLQAINTLRFRIRDFNSPLAKESAEFTLSILTAGQEKMAKSLVDLSAPAYALSIYRALGHHIDVKTPI